MPRDLVFLINILGHAHGTGHEGTEKTWHRLHQDFHVWACTRSRVTLFIPV
jgi:hypothetical protein